MTAHHPPSLLSARSVLAFVLPLLGALCAAQLMRCDGPQPAPATTGTQETP